MAPLSLVLSFLAKKIGSVLQIVFGWSVTALFGRLESKREIAVSVALVLSLAWPVFVVGAFVPAIAAWALAFLPLHDWIGDGVLRILWIVLAVVAPLLVGAIVRWVAPAPRSGYLATMVNGYRLAAAFFGAFVITLVTAPILKIFTIARGWTDTHVFVQPRADHYDDLVHKVAEACARAGALPEVVDAPKSMTLATSVLRKLASSSVQPIIADQLRVVRAKGVEAYVYPSDLLLRGDPKLTSRLRSMLGRAEVDTIAYVVKSEEGRQIQDELQHLFEFVDDHRRRGVHVSDAVGPRIVGIWREMTSKDIPFEEWTHLETILRRLEREFVALSESHQFVVDEAPDGLEKVTKEAHGELRDPLSPAYAT